MPLRFGFTLFPGAVQYAHTGKLSNGRVLIGHCLCLKFWHYSWGRILQGAPPPLWFTGLVWVQHCPWPEGSLGKGCSGPLWLAQSRRWQPGAPPSSHRRAMDKSLAAPNALFPSTKQPWQWRGRKSCFLHLRAENVPWRFHPGGRQRIKAMESGTLSEGTALKLQHRNRHSTPKKGNPEP